MWNYQLLIFLDEICQSTRGEGYTIIEACNDYEGLPQDHARLVVALPPQDPRYLVAF